MVFFLLVVMVSVTAEKAVAAGSAWAVIDAETGRLLEGSNENVLLPIASLTKIWTALTCIESGTPPGDIVITPTAASAEGSSLYMKQGTKMHSDSLLYGLMLRSGNDAATALAEYTGGSVEGFVDLMNTKAIYYGLDDTVFTNPSGLHDEKHLSTAYETALMMHFAMENEKFKTIATTKNHKYQRDGENFNWRNKHRLLHSDPEVIAGKTGFTKAAGRTLVTYYERSGKKIIVVTLNDGNDWNTHRHLATKIFSEYKLETIAKKGRYSLIPGVEMELKSPVRLLLKKGEKNMLTRLVQIPRNLEDNKSGVLTVSFDNNPLLTKKVNISRE
jgi:D-alanyl-D-alanine carboxypeptidase